MKDVYLFLISIRTDFEMVCAFTNSDVWTNSALYFVGGRKSSASVALSNLLEVVENVTIGLNLVFKFEPALLTTRVNSQLIYFQLYLIHLL